MHRTSQNSVVDQLLNTIGAGKHLIPSDSPIWHSTFSDSIWVFESSSSPTFKGKKSSSINWDDLQSREKHHASRYKLCLTNTMVQELKIATFIYAHFPKFFRGSRTKKTTIDGKTVLGRVQELAKIGSHFVRVGSEEGSVIESFSDISFEMLKLHSSSIGGRPGHLKRALRLLAEEVVQKNLPNKLQFSLNDLNSKSLNWGEAVEYRGIPTLSDQQFLLLLSHCKRAIAEFKIVMHFEIHDKDIINSARSGVTESGVCIREPLEKYIWESHSRNIYNHANKYRTQYGYSLGEMKSFYSEAHKASMLLILMLTGMRSSETSYLKVNSLEFKDGVRYLISKVAKQTNEASPVNQRWLVIPIVEDAYDVLSYACLMTGNTALFSSPYSIIRSSEQGYTGLNTTLKRWIDSIDSNGLFKNHKFSVHQCRETLAHQLAKNKVGLPFIAKQLKHFHNRFDRMPNSVTAGYGDYKKNLLLSIESRMAGAREEVLMDMYGEGKNFAGGGSEIHRTKIDAWFKGVGLFGEHRKKYIRKMAESNITFMPTSIGLCTHNFIETQDGVKPPPCYGDYSCDPNCPNHVISEGCASALKDRERHASQKAIEDKDNAEVWSNLAEKLNEHVKKLNFVSQND